MENGNKFGINLIKVGIGPRKGVEFEKGRGNAETEIRRIAGRIDGDRGTFGKK